MNWETLGPTKRISDKKFSKVPSDLNTSQSSHGALLRNITEYNIIYSMYLRKAETNTFPGLLTHGRNTHIHKVFKTKGKIYKRADQDTFSTSPGLCSGGCCSGVPVQSLWTPSGARLAPCPGSSPGHNRHSHPSSCPAPSKTACPLKVLTQNWSSPLWNEG